LKKCFPGDREFALDNFYNLPYLYVLDAVEFASKNRQRELHENEAPVSLLSSILANSNRDPKKNKKPFKIDDFFLYKPKENSNIPTGVYGSAAMALLDKGLFPRWALFVYKDLKDSATGDPPDILAFMHESAILLAPLIKDGIVKGMLICEDRAFDKKLTMKSSYGQEITVSIPSFNGRYAAVENIELEIIR
jgi:hypothetical protein